MRSSKHNSPLSGLRMTASERVLGRFLRALEGHEGAAPAAAAEGEAGEASAEAADGEAAESSILGGAVSPGSGEGEAGKDGAAAEGEATSDDAAESEAAPSDAPFEGLAAPEGFAALDAEALTAATPILRSLGVDTPERAQEVVNEFAPVLSGMMERALAANAEAGKQAQAAIAQEWADQIRNDPDLGGANYDRTVSRAAKVLDTFFDSEFRDFLTVSKLGNNPAMARGLEKIARELEEGSIHLGSASLKEKAPHQKLYDPVYDGPQTPG